VRKGLSDYGWPLVVPVHDSKAICLRSFYNQFRLAPLGKHHVRVCMGTACHLAGGKLVLQALERELDIKVGETARNKEFSLERVACVGCCMLAPVVLIGEDVHPKMTPFKVEEALIPYRHEA